MVYRTPIFHTTHHLLIQKTLRELHWLRDFNNGLVNEMLVKEGDDVKGERGIWKVKI